MRTMWLCAVLALGVWACGDTPISEVPSSTEDMPGDSSPDEGVGDGGEGDVGDEDTASADAGDTGEDPAEDLSAAETGADDLGEDTVQADLPEDTTQDDAGDTNDVADVTDAADSVDASDLADVGSDLADGGADVTDTADLTDGGADVTDTADGDDLADGTDATDTADEEVEPEPAFGVPLWTLAWVDDTQCPRGWLPYEGGEGRFLVGTTTGDEVGVEVGTALAVEETRSHDHSYSDTVLVLSQGLAAASGCCNGTGGAAGSYTASGVTEGDDVLPPRVLSLLCVHTEVVEYDDHGFPNGSIMFFNTEACPAGWSPYDDADGRLILSTPNGGTVGETVGTALSSGEDRVHSHSFASSISVDEFSLIAAGGANQNHAASGTYNVGGTTGSTSAGLPYIQQLVCQADDREFYPGFTDAGREVVMPGTLAFFESETCPSFWERVDHYKGRFMLSLMPDGEFQSVAGGDPLSPGEDRTHTHGFSGSVSIPELAVAAGTGCCRGGMGKKGTYNYSGTTATSSSGVPYVSLLGCEKQ